METWKTYLKKDPADRLLTSSDPSVRYFALTALLGTPPGEPDAVRCRDEIRRSARVTTILSALRDGQTFRETGNDSLKRFSGTLWQLMLLLELGCDPALPELREAAEYLLDANFDETRQYFVSWKNEPQAPCYQAQILWSVLTCGLADDPRVKTVLAWIGDTVKFHDGDETADNPDDRCLGRHTCIRAAVPLVQALSSVPSSLQNDKLTRLLRDGNEFLLVHRVYWRSHDPSKTISPYMTRLTFPGFYYPDMLQILALLTNEGIFDERMEYAVKAVLKKQNDSGMWRLDREYNERKPGDLFPVTTDFGARGTDNEWITLRALCMLKKWYEHTGTERG